jgi:transcriptional regulator with XRE-family HTH domain
MVPSHGPRDEGDQGLRGAPVGTNLRALCLAAGISQAELTRAAGMNRATVHTAEIDGHAVKVVTRYKLLLAFNRLADEAHQSTLDAMLPPSHRD